MLPTTRTTRWTLALAVLALASSATAALAVEKTTPICGRTVRADQALIDNFPDFISLGDAFKATLVTDDADGTCVGNACECMSAATTGDHCGLVTASAAGQVVQGLIVTIEAPDASSWSATGIVDTFQIGGFADASIPNLDTVILEKDGPRSPADETHPNFPDGAVGGSADVVIKTVLSQSPYLEGTFTLTASVETIGAECAQFVPALPVWGFPLLGVAMLASGAAMLRRRA